jgi:hypothetical protein
MCTSVYCKTGSMTCLKISSKYACSSLSFRTSAACRVDIGAEGALAVGTGDSTLSGSVLLSSCRGLTGVNVDKGMTPGDFASLSKNRVMKEYSDVALSISTRIRERKRASTGADCQKGDKYSGNRKGGWYYV